MRQPMLPGSDSSIEQRVALRTTRNEALKDEQKLMSGKRWEVFLAISRAAQGLTMREMAENTRRGINCWTQPFQDLRDAGVIVATNERRNRGIVHRLAETCTVDTEGW